jgi:drug/metabolite transporter (DMT)-like permease
MTRQRAASASSPAPIDLRTASVVTTFCLVWGGAMVAIKVGLAGAPPLSAAGIRFALASVTLLSLEAARGRRLNVGADSRRPVLLLALLLVVQHGLFNLGLNLTTASRAAVFLYSQPIFVALLAHRYIKDDRLDAGKLLGVALSFAGLVIAFAERLQAADPRAMLGDSLILLSAICWAIQTILQKDLLAVVDPSALILHQMAIAAPLFLLLSLLFEPALIYAVDVRIVLAFLYQGVIAAGLTFAAFAALLKRHQVSLLSSFIFLAPIFGVLLGHLLLDDPLTGYLGLGLALVAGGIFIVNRPRKSSQFMVHSS